MGTNLRTSTLAVGDRVSWMHSSSNGASWSFSTREGKVLMIRGHMAQLQMRNGRKCWQYLDQLTKDGETTTLTRLFMGLEP
jgi:hypothetical protein